MAAACGASLVEDFDARHQDAKTLMKGTSAMTRSTTSQKRAERSATTQPAFTLPSLSGFRRAYAQGWIAEFWASFWPAILPLLGVLALFFTLSWLDVWQAVPRWAHITGIGLLALAAIAALKPLMGIHWPARHRIVRRIEAESSLAHRPLHALTENMAAPGDAKTNALWVAHRARMAKRISNLTGGFPSARIAERDPYALRAIIVLALIIAGAYAGPLRGERVALAFDFSGQASIDVTRLDAWVSPPAYTGRAPILLRASQFPEAMPEMVVVPAGSVLVVRSDRTDGLAVDFTPEGGTMTTFETEAGTATDAQEDASQRLNEIRLDLTASGEAAIRQHRRALITWPFEVTADEAPAITLDADPERLTSGATRLAYSMSDDYGVIRAQATIKAAGPTPGTPTLSQTPAPDADPLIPAPTIDLTLPQLRTRSGTAQTIRDLTAHPWAGAEVLLTLTAEDDLGQTGTTAPHRFRLPSRQFLDPLARAVVEQRRMLATDRANQDPVWRTLDALTLAPDSFDMEMDHYLGLRSAKHRLQAADNDEQLISVVDQLWDIALAIENGDLSDAAQRLQAAQEALQNALDNNASDQEIAELVDELRQALNEFMQELARQAQNPDNLGELGEMSDMEMLSPQDLNDMLDAIEDMARSGARDEAQQMLSELRNMLENLQAGNNGEQSTEQSAMARALQELSELIQRQQELMDQTYRLDRFGPPGSQPNQQGQQGEQQGQQGQQQGQGRPMTAEELEQAIRNALEGLEAGQGALAEALQALREQLDGQGQGQQGQPGEGEGQGEGMGMGEGEGHGQGTMPGQGQLGQAGRAMQRALGALGQGQPGQAQGAQSDALQALRDGARQLADALANAMGMTGQAQGPQRTDPFGRPLRTQGPDTGDSVKVPEEFDAERARELLRELRRRLSQPDRPRPEREYLERLLGR
jgi:uncharacterized protein (TIGR02302 family)